METKAELARQKRLQRFKDYYQRVGKAKYQSGYKSKKQKRLEAVNLLKEHYQKLMEKYQTPQ